jgi:hypothetical protein
MHPYGDTHGDPYSDMIAHVYSDTDAPDYGPGGSGMARRGKRSRKKEARRPLHGVPLEEIQRRRHFVEQCVRIGMSVRHMVAFLPTWGVTLSRSQVYDYLSDVKRPRRYESAWQRMSTHDRLALDCFVKIAVDAAVHGIRTEQISKASPVPEGRFRPDLHWFMGGREYFLEMQSSPLEETRWTTKFRNYLRLYNSVKRPFSVLFVIGSQYDRVRAREYARKSLIASGHRLRTLFLFCRELEVLNAGNASSDPVWQLAWGDGKPATLV